MKVAVPPLDTASFNTERALLRTSVPGRKPLGPRGDLVAAAAEHADRVAMTHLWKCSPFVVIFEATKPLPILPRTRCVLQSALKILELNSISLPPWDQK